MLLFERDPTVRVKDLHSGTHHQLLLARRRRDRGTMPAGPGTLRGRGNEQLRFTHSCLSLRTFSKARHAGLLWQHGERYQNTDRRFQLEAHLKELKFKTDKRSYEPGCWQNHCLTSRGVQERDDRNLPPISIFSSFVLSSTSSRPWGLKLLKILTPGGSSVC